MNNRCLEGCNGHERHTWTLRFFEILFQNSCADIGEMRWLLKSCDQEIVQLVCKRLTIEQQAHL